MSMDRVLSRLGAAERKVLGLGLAQQDLYRAAAAVRQNLHSPDTSGAPCEITWHLTFYGCGTSPVLPLDGLDVELRDQVLGSVLASGTTDGSGFVSLATSFDTGGSSGMGVDVVRLDDRGGATSTAFGTCGTTFTDNVPYAQKPGSLGLGCYSDYFCLDDGCAWPLSMAQSLHDPYFGVDVPLFYTGCPSGGPRILTGSMAVPYAASGACAARASVDVDWTVNYETGVITAEHNGSIAGCPNNVGPVVWALTWDMDIICPTAAPLSLTNTGINFSDGGGSDLYAGTSPSPVVTEV